MNRFLRTTTALPLVMLASAHDSDQLADLLESLKVQNVEYEQFQHPEFHTGLGFSGDAPTEKANTTLLVIEPIKFSYISDAERHGEYAAAIANTYADFLSQRDIGVIYANHQANIAINWSLEGSREFWSPGDSANIMSGDYEDNTSIFQNSDVVSISYNIEDPFLRFGSEYRDLLSQEWNKVDSFVFQSAGNNGKKIQIREVYEDARIIAPDFWGPSHYPQYSMSVGSVSKDEEEYVVAEYSSPSAPAFVDLVGRDGSSPENAKFQYYETDNLAQAVRDNGSAKMYASRNKRDIAKEIKGFSSIEFIFLQQIPEMFQKVAEVIEEIGGCAEDTVSIKARHIDNMVDNAVASVFDNPYIFSNSDTVPGVEELTQVVKKAFIEGELDNFCDLSAETLEDIRNQICYSAHRYMFDTTSRGEPEHKTMDQEIMDILIEKHVVLEVEKILKEGDEKLYFNDMQGTSFSAPTFAGRVAALKELHSDASNEDLIWALASTAHPVYSVESRDDITLTYRQNAAGLWYNPTHAGFGAPDFDAANELLGEMERAPGVRKHVESSDLTLSSRNALGNEYTIDVPEKVLVTKATIELKMACEYVDSEMVVTSPNGDEVLFRANAHDQTVIVSTTFFLNTNGEGVWTIRTPDQVFIAEANLLLQGIEVNEVSLGRSAEQKDIRADRIESSAIIPEMFEEGFAPDIEEVELEVPGSVIKGARAVSEKLRTIGG